MKGMINPLIIAGIIGLVVILALSGFRLGNIPATLTGFTVLSLSEASFVNNANLPDGSIFSGNAWIMTVRQGGMAQHAVGTITPSEVNSESGVQPEENFEISIDYSRQSCEYPLQARYSSQKIGVIERYEWTCALPPSYQEGLNHCPNQMIGYGKYPFSFECYCLQVPTASPVDNYIENGYVHTVSTITVQAGQSSSSLNIDTTENIRGYIGNNVYAVWDGYLGSGQSCSSPDQYAGVYSQGRWKLGNKNYYNTYVSWYDGLLQLMGSSPSKDQITNYLNNANNYANWFLNTPASFGTVENPTDINNAIVVNDVPSFIAFPLYTFFVKADWLGIYQPVGRPDILSVQTETFSSGAEGTARVNVKNVGDDAEVFNVWINCPSPFSMIGGTQERTVNPGSTQLFTLGLTADVSSYTEVTCTAYAQGVEYTDTMIFTASADPQIVCTPNSWTCENGNPHKCNSAGSGTIQMDTCTQEEECVYRTDGSTYCRTSARCGDGVCDFGEEFTCPEDCQEPSVGGIGDILASIFAGIIVAFILLIAIVIIGMFVPVIRPFTRKLHNMQNFILSVIILGIILGVLFTGLTLSAASMIMGMVS